jgi:hypothetical protein
MSLPFMRNESGFVTVVEGQSYNIHCSHSKYADLLRAVKSGDSVEFLKNCTEEKAIQSYISQSPTLSTKVQLKDGEVTYDGRPVHNTLTQRILDFKREDLPFEPLLKFMEKLYQNPSFTAINGLYDFLENKNLPITPEGDFLAYKKVKSDYFSSTAGDTVLIKGKVVNKRVFNGIGEEIQCKRNQVDDNSDNQCSYGLHVGGLSYASSFSGQNLIIVRVNPADVIAVPKDYNAQKCRVCHYIVVEDYKQALPSTLSTATNCDENCSCYNEEDEEYINTYDDDGECDDCDDEAYEGLSVVPAQVRKGDEISFIYNGEERSLDVEITTDLIVNGEILEDDPKWDDGGNNYRNFSKSKMIDVYVLN